MVQVGETEARVLAPRSSWEHAMNTAGIGDRFIMITE